MEIPTLADTRPFEDVVYVERPQTRSYRRAHIWSGALFLIAILSIFVLAPFASNPQTLGGIRVTLDQQQATVGGMAAAATGLSAALSVIPGDAMTPIADQLAELSSWFIVIIGAIVLQKLLLTTSGFIAFSIIIPLACVLGIVFAYSGKATLRSIALKLATFGVVLFLAVPGSIVVSGWLTQTHTDLSAIQQTTSTAVEDKPSTDEKPAKGEKPTDVFGQIQGWLSDIGASVGNAVDKVIVAADQFRQDAVNELNLFIEKIALFIITTCVMPLLVFLLFGWVIKLLFNIDTGIDRVGRNVQAGASRANMEVRRTTARLTAREPGGTND